jgi:hypothetical protein
MIEFGVSQRPIEAHALCIHPLAQHPNRKVLGVRTFGQCACYGDMTWTGNELRLGRRTIAAIEPDAEWPGMWRAKIGDHLTDMANRTRAKDAAMCLALGILNTREKPSEAPRIRFSERVTGYGEHLTHGRRSSAPASRVSRGPGWPQGSPEGHQRRISFYLSSSVTSSSSSHCP